MALRQLDRDLWCIDHTFRVGGLALGARTTVVRLPDNGLVLHSPGPIDDAEAAAIDQVGKVTALLGPNLLHHLYLQPARARWPEAQLVAPAGLQRKRPDLRIDVALDVAAPRSPWPGVLVPVGVGGMPKLDEIAWLHPPSRTLLLGDLAFNVRPPAPWFTRVFMRLNHGWDRFGPTRILRSTIQDRAATRRGIEAVLQHDFDRVVVGHGQVVEGGGHDGLRHGFAWLIVPSGESAPTQTPR